jgi:hypothetical protein
MFNGALNSLLANSGDDVVKAVAKNYTDDVVKSVVNNNADDIANSFIAKFAKSTGDKAIDSRIKSVVMMSPDDYLQKAFEATDGRLGGSFDSWLKSNAVDPLTTAKYSEAMKRGDEFPLAYIDNALGSQDGRNRALAVKMAGGKEMPVGIIPEMTNDEAIKHYSELLSGTNSAYLKNVYQNKLNKLNSEIPEAAKQYLQPATSGNLMAIHNLSPDKLAFSDELGGMAMPSIGIVDPNVGTISGYGDITLVGNKNLVDPKIAANRNRVF